MNLFLAMPQARGILVAQPEMEPATPALGAGVLTTGQPGKSPQIDILELKSIIAKQ